LSPGNVSFESAPFKLTKEYVELMDGVNSDKFFYFKSLLAKGTI
jgi:phosphatidylinositol 4-kinase